MINAMREYAMGRRAVLLSMAALAATQRQARAQTPQPGPSIIRSSDGRDVQVSTWQPHGARRGTVLFSHGFASSPWKYQKLLQPWADAGFQVLAPLHRDSTDHPDHAHFLPAQTLPTRLLDMRATAGMIPNTAYVAAGHSYGGLIALTLGGAKPTTPPGMTPPLSDPNAKAALAFSPPGPVPDLITQQGYESISVPVLVQTGDHDFPIINGKPGDWHAHLSAFDAAPGKQTYGLVLPGVDHFFGNIICKPEKPGPPLTAQFAEALDVSMLFLSAFGAGDAKARTALAQKSDLLKKA
jgi:pimeloyl-ACP methyl ester carboxylesterase